MEAIVRWCLKNRSVVSLATVILMAGGAYATTRLNQELLPDIEFPIITVSTPVPGAGAHPPGPHAGAHPPGPHAGRRGEDRRPLDPRAGH
jgi:hypothetical protein